MSQSVAKLKSIPEEARQNKFVATNDIILKEVILGDYCLMAELVGFGDYPDLAVLQNYLEQALEPLKGYIADIRLCVGK